MRLRPAFLATATVVVLACWVVVQYGDAYGSGPWFPLVWLGVTATIAGGWLAFLARRGEPTAWSTLPAAGAIGLWLLIDLAFVLHPTGFYDLTLYRNAGARFLAGHNPYLADVLVHLPPATDPGPFLYPPVALPVVAAMSQVPMILMAPLWIGILGASGFLAFRLLGMRGLWPLVFLAFPPLVRGVESGNVANLLFLLFAGGVRLPAVMPLAGTLKLQAGIPGLWLLRERRWRALVLAILTVLGLVVLTLPFTGVSAWWSWWLSLDLYRRSAEGLPALYDLSLAGLMPLWAFLGLSLFAVAVAIVLQGRRSLAALGLASLVASPSLWSHGFLFALPAVLMLDPLVLWPVLGVAANGPWLWLLVVAGIAALGTGWRGVASATSPAALAATPIRDGPWADAVVRANPANA